jgi:4-oxalocrotonate tautomerase
MPVITIRFIKDVVATPEQKRELIVKMTDTFVGVLGDVVRPFTYCIIEETPVGEWGIAGVPMPDLEYLISPKHAQVIERSNDLMRSAIAQMKQAQEEAEAAKAHERDQHADDMWRGSAD